MAKIERMPDGFVRIEAPGGLVTVPEEVAREAIPDLELPTPTEPTLGLPSPVPAPDFSEFLEPQEQSLDEPSPGPSTSPAPALAPEPQPRTTLGMPVQPPGVSESVSVKVQPGVVVPAGGKFQKVDPGPIQKGYDLIGQGIQSGMQRIADAAGKRLVARSGEIALEREAAGDIAEVQQLEMQRREQANQAMAQQAAELEKRITETRAKVQRMNPNRVFENMSNFDRSVMLISSALAGALAARQGHTKNSVIETVMRLVEQDIESQKVDIETQREDVYRAERAYDRGVARLQQEEMAKREMAIYKIEAIKTKLAADKMQFASVITRAEYDEMIGQLEVKQGELFKDLYDATVGNVFRAVSLNNQAEQSRQSLANERARLAQRRIEFKYQQKRDELADKAAAAKARAEQAGNIIGVSTGFGEGSGESRTDLLAPDPKLADELRKQGIAAGQVYTALSRLENLDLTRLKNNPDEYAAVSKQVAAALLGWMEVSGERLGRTTERDMQYAKDAVIGGDPSKFMQLLSEDHFRKSLLESKDDLQKKLTKRAQSWGNKNATWEPPVVETEAEPTETSGITAAQKLDEISFGAKPTLVSPPGTPEIFTPHEGDPTPTLVPGVKLSEGALQAQAAEAMALTGTILADARDGRLSPTVMIGYATTIQKKADELARAAVDAKSKKLAQTVVELRNAASALLKLAEPDLARRETKPKYPDIKH